MTKNFVRGGQLNIHSLRMIKQVIIFSILISLSATIVTMGILTYKAIPSYLIRQYIVSYKAEWMMLVKHKSKQQTYNVSWPEETHNKFVRAVDIIGHPYVKQLRSNVEEVISEQFMRSLFAGLASLILLIIFWVFKGRHSHKHKTLRGQVIVSPKHLARLIRRAKLASKYKVEDVPLIKNSETKHFLAIGTIGAGKTNWFNEVLPQIQSQKAIVIDTTGDMISKYYDEIRGDVILNPFDERTSYWDIISECRHGYEFDDLAKAIIPPSSNYQDPLWKNGSAKLLSVGLQKAQEEDLSTRDLFSIFSEVKLGEFGHFFAGTDAYPFADPKGEKTTMSFRSTLSSYTQFLKVIGTQTEKTFSVKRWVEDEQDKSWVFITANENMLQTLNPYIAAIFNMVTTSLMSLPEDLERRMWFVMDELPALQKLEALQSLLSKGRKYGACIIGGIQSMSQFEELYGQQGSKTILNLFNSKFFFRLDETSACDQVSRWLGEEEIEEAKEGLSYGAHQMRDGVSLNTQNRQRRLVMPTEISQLKDLECFVKLPGAFPITKLQMTLNIIKPQAQSFQL